MNETLSPQDAARVVAEATRYEDGLIQRAEGLTNMVWGIVSSAIFASYALAAIIKATGPVFGLIWLPWVVAGFALTGALWRAVAHERPAEEDLGLRDFLVKGMLVTLVFIAVFAFVDMASPYGPLAAIGGLFLALSIVNPYRCTPLSKWGMAFAGAVTLLAGIILGWANVPILWLGILLSGGPLFLAGFYQTLRG